MTRITIPWWLTVIIILETLPMFLGPLVALREPGMAGGVGATEFVPGAMLYVARNVAVGVALIIAYVLRSAPMLFALIVVRLITDLFDLPSMLHYGIFTNVPLNVSIFLFLYYIPAVYALVYLWKQMNGEKAKPA